MNRYHWLIAVLAFVLQSSCGDKTEVGAAGESAGVVKVADNPAGEYEGNLGCVDCKGLKTTLEIKADSTFIIRETRLTTGQLSPQESLTGKVNFLTDRSIIELVGREEGKTKWLKTDESGNLLVVNQEGVAVVDSLGGGTLSRTTQWTQRFGNVNVYEYVKPFAKYPARVFHRIQNGDITIDRKYIANAPEHEKALIACYASLYQAGCSGDVCILKEELKGEAEKLTSKYFQNDPVIRPMLEASKSTPGKELEMLMIFSNQGKIRVQTAVFGDDGKLVNSVDEFSLSGENLVRISTEESDNTRKRAVSNVRSRETAPMSQSERDKILKEQSKSPASSTQKK